MARFCGLRPIMVQFWQFEDFLIVFVPADVIPQQLGCTFLQNKLTLTLTFDFDYDDIIIKVKSQSQSQFKSHCDVIMKPFPVDQPINPIHCPQVSTEAFNLCVMIYKTAFTFWW